MILSILILSNFNLSLNPHHGRGQMENSTQPAYSEVIRNAANETKSKNDDKVASERQIESPQILSVVMLTYYC